jgi:hypothetical protein
LAFLTRFDSLAISHTAMNINKRIGWLSRSNKSILSSLILGLIVGCQDLKDIQQLDPLKGVVFKINYEPSPTTIQGLVVDAKTGTPLSVPVQVTIFGPDANRIVSYEGEAVSSFQSPKADLFLGLKGEVPSATKPAEVRIVVSATGYIRSSIYLFIDKAKPEPFSIRLVKKADPPAGVVLNQESIETAPTGMTKQAKSITTPTNASMTTRATVTLPANTLLTDAKGQPVVGNLSAQLVAYSSQTELSLRAFPGGFTTRVTRDDQGNTNVKGTFSPIGYVSIELTTASGQQATTLSQPVIAMLEIAGQLKNPQTGQPLKPGDQLPVFSYNENTGEWTYEQNVPLTQAGTGLVVSMPVRHLSGYHLAFWTPSGKCVNGGQWTLSGKPEGKPIKWVLYNANQQYVSDGLSSENTITIPRLSSGAARLDLFSPDGKLVGSSTVSDACGSHNVSVAYPQNLIDLDISVTAYCENRTDIVVSPSAWVRYRKVGTTNWQQSFLTAGQGKLVGLEPNTEYEAGVDYNGFNSVRINSGQTSGNQTIRIKLPDTISICQQ